MAPGILRLRAGGRRGVGLVDSGGAAAAPYRASCREHPGDDATWRFVAVGIDADGLVRAGDRGGNVDHHTAQEHVPDVAENRWRAGFAGATAGYCLPATGRMAGAPDAGPDP